MNGLGNPLNKSARTRLIILSGILSVGFLVLNFILFWIPGDEPAQSVKVYFSQRYNKVLYDLQCLSMPLSWGFFAVGVVLAVTASRYLTKLSLVISTAVWAVYFACLLICIFANYSGIFIRSFVELVGSAILDGNTYHLLVYSKYDDPTLYYLAKCDQTGDWCEFHKFYEAFLYNPGSPQITSDAISKEVIVKFGEMSAYAFDGQVGRCLEESPTAATRCFETIP